MKRVKMKTLRLQYVGYVNYKGAPYPYYFTSNTNMRTGTSIRLSDLISINQSLVEKLQQGKFTGLKSFQTNSLDGMTKDDLLIKLKASDSYLTKDSLGISTGVPQAIGIMRNSR
jgi:hypothetical protein